MQTKKFNQINVIPFIDIMLVLLVIVLTTATFVAKGVIPVDLPNASSQAKELEKEDLVITIKSDGELFVDEKAISKEDFLQVLKSHDRKKPVIINSDKQTRFEHFVYVLDSLKLNGFTNVGVLSQNE
jgi:biopolymer transport protein ExbD